MADRKSFLLRLNMETWVELERWAADEFRSVNGQIEFLLSEAIRQRRKKKPAGPDPTAGKVPNEERP